MTGTDLLSLLRREASLLEGSSTLCVNDRPVELLRKAADEIERLRAENDELRQAEAVLKVWSNLAKPELETLRGIAARLADDWHPVECVHWQQIQGDGRRVTEAMTHAEVEAIYGKEQSHDGK